MDSPTATVTFVSLLSAFDTVCVTFTLSASTSCPTCEALLLFNPFPSLTSHVPSDFTVVVLTTLSATLTVILAPAIPLPVKVLSVDNTRFSFVVLFTVGATGRTLYLK